MPKPTRAQLNDAIDRLKEMFPEPGAMEIGGAYQAIVGVALSARTRDEQVLKLMPAFFSAFPTVQDLAKASVDDIRSKINTIGMFNQKAKNLKGMAEMVVQDFGGKIPNTMEDLIKLPGVGRKTASVILPYIFGKPAIAVDTHVHRVTNRLGWVMTKTPEQTEKELLKIIPDDLKRKVNQVFVKHGRYVCITNPRCWTCPVADICAFKNKNLEAPLDAEDIRKDIARREGELQLLREKVLNHENPR